MANQTITTLKYANLHMAAEAMLNDIESYEQQLTTGNDHASRFTTTQATQFAQEWKVIEHKSNTATGFSGTLFKYTGEDNPARGLRAGELVLSFRSTEFIDDAARDNQATNTMEIKPFGWAFGQIADMRDWFETLNADPQKLGGNKPFAVTGYSLGGHLATAFNQLIYERNEGSRITETYTFNGAGVGEIKKPNQTNLNSIIDQFNIDRRSGSGGGGGDESNGSGGNGGSGSNTVGISFAGLKTQQLYESLRGELTGGKDITDAHYAEFWNAYPEASNNIIALDKESRMLLDAMNRIKVIQEEAKRVPNLSASGKNPQDVPTTNIEATGLNYQLAVLRAAEKTSAYSMVLAAYNLATNDRTVKGRFPNFYDVYGEAPPSMVASSQIHKGQKTPIYIEDQPLYRGTFAASAIKASIESGWEIKLLASGYDKNDFGDTHSLVLLVDSLSVQAVLSKLDPNTSINTLTEILKRASNKQTKAETGQDGKAEGDVLENVVSSLGTMLGVLSEGNKLKGNLGGNTWHITSDEGGFTGRETFHKKLADIETAISNKGLEGKVKIGATNTDLGALARDDFGAMATLLSMSPVSLTASSPEHRDKLADELKGQFSEYAAWKADKEMSAQDKAAGKQTYSDAYLRARAEFLDWKGKFNNVNRDYDQDLGQMRVLPGLLLDPLGFIKERPLPISGDHVYQDNQVVDGKKLTLQIDGRNPTTLEKHHITLGVEAAETLSGGDIEDHLFGGAGADTLKGLGGSDYLEGNEGADNLLGGGGKDILVGGKDDDILNGGQDDDQLKGGEGTDTYKFDNQFGHDTIIDADGKGFIEVAGIGKLDGANAKKVAGQEGVWRSVDGKVTYTKVQLDTSAVNFDSLFRTGLEIKFADKPNDSILIKGWSSEKNMGLEFDPAPEAPKPSSPHVGNFQKETSIRYQQGANRLVYTETYGGYVSTGQSQENAEDYIAAYASTADENFRLEGLGGNDALFGAVNDDFIDGGDGDDFLAGGGGQDSIYGGSGRDYILGSNFYSKYDPRDEQNRIMYVEVGKEHPAIPDDATLKTQGFDWAIYTQPIEGSDQVKLGLQGLVDPYIYPWNHLVFQDKGRFIDAGDDNDYVISGTGADTTYGGEGDDTLTGLDDADILAGGLGKDLIFGDGTSQLRYAYLPDSNHGSDVISGGEGDDQLIGQGKDDQVFGGDGDDKLWGDGQGDQLDPTDTPYDIQGNDYLDGGAGADQLIGGGRDDQLIGGGGDDRLWGDFDLANLGGSYHGKDVLDGEQGDDYLEGGGNEDTLRGGEGNDRLLGDVSSMGLTASQSGADSLEGGQGDDYLDGGGKSDVLFGGSGSDELHGDGEFAAANDQGDDFLDGGEGSDGLFGEGGDDYLRGGAGDDFLYGGDGDDYLEGGFGADVLKGGGGNDIYAFDGEDTRMDSSGSGGGLADTVKDNEGSNTIILGGASTTGIAIYKDTSESGTANIFLSHDSAVRIQDIAGGMNNTFVLGNGNELKTNQLIGRHADTTTTGAFSFLTAGGQEQVMAGFGDDNINVSANQSTVSGGGGDDFINATGVANTYLYVQGDGNDVIVDASVANGSLDVLGGSTIVFGAGISASDISLKAARGNDMQEGGISQPGQFLVVQVGGGSSTVVPGRIAIDGFDFTNPIAPLPVATLKFADGSELLLADLLASSGVLTTGTDSNDAVQGIWRAETLSGGQGDDTLTGEAGGDTYQWGLGDGKDKVVDEGPSSDIDTLQLLGALTPADLKFSRVANDLVVRIATASGTTGDELTIQNHFAAVGADGMAQGIDKVVFGNSVVWSRADIAAHLEALPPLSLTNGNDSYVGTPVDDTVFALAGDDTVRGHDGNDKLDGGDGDDYLAGEQGNDQLMGAAGNDWLFGDAGDDGLDGGLGMDQLSGGIGNDTINGGNDSVQDRLDGGQGNDLLIDPNGHDSLIGGEGDDTLEGGAAMEGGEGSDTYRLTVWPSPAQSELKLTETVTMEVGNDVLELPAGIQLSDLVFRRDPVVGEEEFYRTNNFRVVYPALESDDLLIRLNGSQGTGSIRVMGYFSNAVDKAGLEQIKLANGQVLTRDDVLARVENLPITTAGNDDITGFRFNDSLDGGAGQDVIYGYNGDDTLNGGSGSDYLEGGTGNDRLDPGSAHDLMIGGTGNDTFVFGWSSDDDVILNNNEFVPGTDKILMVPGVLPSDVKLVRGGSDLILQLGESAAQLTVPNYFITTGPDGQALDAIHGTTGLPFFGGIKSIEFSNGVVWTAQDMAARVFTPVSTVTTVGTVDTVTTSLSKVLSDGQENLTAAGSLNVELVGNTGNNVIRGNDGNNNIKSSPTGSLNEFQQWRPSQVWLNWTDSGASVSTTLVSIHNYPLSYDLQRGDDTLIGGRGDDIYFVDGSEGFNFGEPAVPRDVVVELANEGDDTIFTSNYSETMVANVENLVAWSNLIKSYELSGAAIPHVYSGNELANRIDVRGVRVLSRVDGGLGADTVYGSSSAKNIYVVDNPGDVIVEVMAAGEVNGLGDTVESSINYTLGSDIENLTLLGSTITTGTGNASANVLDGSTNSAANTLVGLAGDDTYIVGVNDTVVEAIGGGNDTVQLTQLPTDVSAPINVSSWANVENLYLAASLGAVNLLGSSVNNKLAGSLAANVVDGADGDDEIFGADPSKVPKDPFSATNALKNILEIDTLNGGNGNDTIYSVGVQDVISGGNGNDTINLYSKLSGQLIDGGSGNDLIQLVNGNSAVTSQLVIQFGLGAGNDTVAAEGFTGTGGKVQISPTTDASRLRFSRSGSNLVVSLTGASDSMTIQSFFDSATSNTVRSGIDAVMLNEETILNRAILVAALNDADMALTSNGDDVQVTSAATTSISGGLGNDRLFGQSTADRLDGGAGNDLLASGDGSDTLIGGAGDDDLTGGRGADTYQFELGWGQDRIVDIPNAQQRQDASVDTVVFATGINATDIAVSRINGYDLKLTHKVSGDSLVVSQFFWPADAAQTGSVELIKFLDGNVTWDLASLTAANKAPTLVQPLQDKTINQGTILNIAIPVNAFVDTDVGDQLTHSATLANGQPLPSWLTFNALNRTFTGTPPASALGIVSIKVTATDSTGEIASDVFDITVTNEAGMNLLGTAGADTLQGGAGNDRIDGGLGSDMMIGGAGNDTYVVDREGDVVVELPDAGTDTVEIYYDTSARLSNHVENLIIKGNAIVGIGNALNNTITGNPNASFSDLRGIEGDDTIFGGVGNDWIEGGEGNDFLEGGSGNNTYAFYSSNGIVSFGQDTIAGNTVDTSANKANTIYLNSVLPSNVTLNRLGEHLKLFVQRPGYGDADSILVKSFFLGAGPQNSKNPVQRIEFSNGTAWNITEIMNRVTPGGGATNTAPTVTQPLVDQVASQGAALSYSVAANTFTDADLGDVLAYSASLSSGAALPSWLSFNPSTRTFSGTAPTDSVGITSIKVTATDAAGASASDVFDWAVAAENKTLTGTNAADALVGYSGNDSLSGAAGNDSLSGNAGNDLLDGGAGADVIDGGSGNDVVLFGLGDGQDVMQEATADSAAGKLNILRIKSGVLASQVSVNRVGADLEVLIAGGNDKVTVKSFFAGAGPLAATNPLQRIEFANGSSWDIAHIQALVNAPVNTAPVVNTPLPDQSVQQGGAVNYTVPVSSFVDADAGDVLSYSATLSDGTVLPSWLSFNASTRTFTGTAPSSLGATSVKVVATDSAGASASDVFDLTVIAADNTLPAKNLVGTPGNDTMFGDTGNDVLNGGSGNDTYYFGRGQGQDQIRDLEWGANTDVLKFLSGVQAEQLWFRNAGNDLEISIIGTTDKVTVRDWYQGEVYWVEQFKTADGRTLNAQSVNAMVSAMAGLTPPPLGQTSLSISQQAALAPVFAANWSGVSVTPPTNTAPVLNTPLVDQSSPQGASVSYTVPASTFSDADAGDVLTYSATLSNGSALPGWLSFNAGTRTFSGTAPTDTMGITSIRVTATDAAGASVHDVFDWVVASENKTITGTSGADVLVGYSGNDSLSGAAGNDSLSGNAGNDVLDGGAGADVIDGGRGNDVVLFGLGDGQDVMQEATADSTAGKVNVLRLKAGVLASQVGVNRVGADLEVLLAGGSDKVTVKSFFAGTGPLAATNPLQRIEFADSTVWDIAHIQTLVNTPANTTPVVTTPLADQSVQQGATVNYTVPTTTFTDADAGDVLAYSATLSNGASLPSWLSFNASTRTFSGSAPSTLGTTSIKVVATDSAGASASDVFDLTVTAADNTLPAKNLVGTPGNDTLFGDSGNDVLDGGSGNDTYYFGRGQGQDQIRDLDWSANTDVLKFLSGVQAEQLWFRNAGNDLEISIIGTPEKVTVWNWYWGEVYQVEQFKTADGRTLNAQNVNALVSAMAGLTPPPLGQTSLSTSQQAALAPVFAANWSGASIAPPPPPPPTNTAPAVNTPLADQSVQQGATVNYTVPVSSFVDADAGDVLSYSATLANGAALPSWLSFNASTRTFTGTAPSSLGATSIKVVATDSAGASASDVFDLTVIAADNTLPAKNLVGTPGNDTLFGDSGNDVLDGGSGNDTYYFGRGQGQDQIRDLDWSANTDVLKFLSGVQAEQLWFRNAGNDLEISIIGTTDKVTVRDWYQGEVYWVEQFKTADGRTLNAQNVNAMVSAMAGLTPPPLGQTSLSTSQQAALAPVFAANWILPAATSANTGLDIFTTESSMKTASTNKLLSGESAKMSMPDPEPQAVILGIEGGFGDVLSATTSAPVKNPRPANSNVKNPSLSGTEDALLETSANFTLQTWDLPLGGKGDQAPWPTSRLPGKGYFSELLGSETAKMSMPDPETQIMILGGDGDSGDASGAPTPGAVKTPRTTLSPVKNPSRSETEDALLETSATFILQTWDLPLGGKGNQPEWRASLFPGKGYFSELSASDLKQLNAGAQMDGSLHALIDAMAAFAPPASGEVTLASNEPDGFKQVIAVDWAA